MSPELAGTLQVLLQWSAPLIIAWAVANTVNAAMKAWLTFKAKNPQAARTMEMAAEMGVRAAEQAGLMKVIAEGGKAKKAFAVDFVERFLRANGIPIDLDLIADMTEAKVIELFPKPQPQLPPPDHTSIMPLP